MPGCGAKRNSRWSRAPRICSSSAGRWKKLRDWPPVGFVVTCVHHEIVGKANLSPNCTRASCRFKWKGLPLLVAHVQRDHRPSCLADNAVVISTATAFKPRFGREKVGSETNQGDQNNQTNGREQKRIV